MVANLSVKMVVYIGNHNWKTNRVELVIYAYIGIMVANGLKKKKS